MARRARVAGLVLGVPLALATARAGTEPAAVPETSATRGRVPAALVGRWLVVHDARLPSKQVRLFARPLEIRQGAEQPEVRLPRVELPDDLKKKVQAAGAAGDGWHPAPEDLDGLTRRWDDLSPTPADYDRVETELFGADAFTDDLKRDEESRGSEVAIVTKEFFSGVQPVKSTIAVYGIREMRPTELAGTFVSTSIAIAPFPIPITLRGGFRAYRLGPPPRRSLLTRLFDALGGCGRR